ncbi:Gfo/Idh/MocA family protein [Arundinibacter roseus]|uniref:Gfo/Idh/MocA family oxidoreductase n=1 Tax=Arundinibacter roseus TaxID=2070510 RepID=A0A4R4KRC6_9BACT|nr:Gfo/Idh/MocA family oxidoreductase [Arundinibacter roseus]TDB69219.1 Gfo/Idh/MocA family oxidoreductase [Arundinibacter roseus]
MEPIRWGILAPGRIAHKFAQDLLTVADATLVAVGSRSLERAQEFARQYNAPYAYGSYEELIACPDIDIVYIASPHTGHHEHTLLCLNAGLPVLCEKPFGMNLGHVQEMVQTAREKKLFLMEALWSRFMPTTLKTLELIQQGAIGKVLGVRADFGFKGIYDIEGRLFNKKLGGGALLDIGIYPLFWSYAILGMPATMKASAVFSETGVDAATGMVLTYDSGAFAFLDATFLAKTDCEAVVYGELGSIRVHGRWHESEALSLELTDQEPQVFDFARSTHGYDFEIKAVGEALRAGLTETPDWSLRDSLNLMTLLDGVREEIGLVYE